MQITKEQRVAIKLLCETGAFLYALGKRLSVSDGVYHVRLGDFANDVFDSDGVVFEYPYGDDTGVVSISSYDEFLNEAYRWDKADLFTRFAVEAEKFVNENESLINDLIYWMDQRKALSYAAVVRLFDEFLAVNDWYEPANDETYEFQILDTTVVMKKVDRPWEHLEIHLVVSGHDPVSCTIDESHRPDSFVEACLERGVEFWDRVIETLQWLY